MARKKGFKKMESLALQADKTLQDLAGIAFANILDFARFEVDGRVHIFDWGKAREVVAQVSVVTRKIGRGKNTREVRCTRIKMPDTFSALIKLLKHLGPTHRKRK